MEQQIKYLDLIQTNPQQFNDNIKKAREQLVEQKNKEFPDQPQYGKKFLQNILTQETENSLRQHRDIDFSLTQQEIDQLKKEKIVFYPQDKFNNEIHSFAHFYLKTFENDLPVMITTDSILHVFHRSFNDLMMHIEIEKLYPLLLISCIKVFILLEEKMMQEKLNLNLIQSYKEIYQYFYIAYSILINSFIDDPDQNIYELNDYSPLIQYFIKAKTITCLEGQQEFTKNIINLIYNENDASVEEIQILKQTIMCDFSRFKARSRYNRTETTRAFFKCVCWLGLVQIEISEQSINDVWLMSCIYNEIKEFDQFIHFYTYIIGGYINLSYKDVYSIVKKQLNSQNDFQEIKQENAQVIHQLIKNKFLENKNVLYTQLLQVDCNTQLKSKQKIQDNDEEEKILISFLPEFKTVDAWLVQQIVQNKENLNEFPRRRICVEDIMYGLFQNNDVLDLLKAQETGTNKDFDKLRDGIKYLDRLEEAKKVIKNSLQNNASAWRSSIYNHWLLLIYRLNQEQPEIIQSAKELFQSDIWKQKMVDTMLGSYTELKHDMIMLTEQNGCEGFACSHPEVILEPNLPFWKEFNNLCINLKQNFRNITLTAYKYIQIVKIINENVYYELFEQSDHENNNNNDQKGEKQEEKLENLNQSKQKKEIIVELKQISKYFNDKYKFDNEQESEKEKLEKQEEEEKQPNDQQVDVDDMDKDNIYDLQKLYLQNLTETSAMLEKVAQSQQEGTQLDEETYNNFKGICFFDFDNYVGMIFSGWYCKLHYNMNEEKIFRADPVIGEIFTAYEDIYYDDPGCHLLIGTKKPKIGIALLNNQNNNKNDKNEVNQQYRAFLFCSYNLQKFEVAFGNRMNDEQWKEQLQYPEEIQYVSDKVYDYQPDFDEDIEDD